MSFTVGQKVRVVDPYTNIVPQYIGCVGTLVADFSDDEDCIYPMRVTLDDYPNHHDFGFLPEEIEAA